MDGRRKTNKQNKQTSPTPPLPHKWGIGEPEADKSASSSKAYKYAFESSSFQERSFPYPHLVEKRKAHNTKKTVCCLKRFKQHRKQFNDLFRSILEKISIPLRTRGPVL
jgi:hypothetical protein